MHNFIIFAPHTCRTDDDTLLSEERVYKTMETNIVRKYDYTLENGVVTKMVVNSSSKMTIGDNTKEVQNHKEYSFVWEEVK